MGCASGGGTLMLKWWSQHSEGLSSTGLPRLVIPNVIVNEYFEY